MKKNKFLVAALAVVALTATGFAAWQVSGGFKNAEKTIDLDPSIETHVDSKVCLNDIEVKGLASNPTELKFDTSKNTVFTYKYNVKGLNTANDQNPYDYYGNKALVIDKTDDMPYLKMSVKYIDKSVAGGVAASDQLVADFNKYFTLNLPEADREVSYTTWLASELKETGYNTQGLSFSWSNYFEGKTPEEFLKTKSIQENENTLAELETIISKIKFQLVFKVEAPTTPVAKEYSGVISIPVQEHSLVTIEGLTADNKVEVGSHLVTLTIDDGYELDGDFKINGEVVTLVEGKVNYPFAKDTAYTISYAVKATEVPPTGGDGSYGNPYTVDEVLELSEMINLANNAYLDHNVYIKGTIELTSDSYTSVYSEQKQYNKVNLKGQTGTLYMYRVYYSDDTLFHNGDEVQIDAALQKYSDKPQVTCNGSDHVSSVALLTHKMHTVQVADGIQNGTVNLDNKFASVACGTEVSFTVTPNQGFAIEAVKVNNKIITGTEGVYKFVVEGDSYISATFKDSSIQQTDIIFTLGADVVESPVHKDNNTAASEYVETVDEITLSLKEMVKVYPNSNDAKGNGCLKLGSSNDKGSFSFDVDTNVKSVKIYVANYKAKSATITVNGVDYKLTGLSDNGEYDEIIVDTTANKTISFSSGTSGDKRCMINTIVFCF